MWAQRLTNVEAVVLPLPAELLDLRCEVRAVVRLDSQVPGVVREVSDGPCKAACGERPDDDRVQGTSWLGA